MKSYNVIINNRHTKEIKFEQSDLNNLDEVSAYLDIVETKVNGSDEIIIEEYCDGEFVGWV